MSFNSQLFFLFFPTVYIVYLLLRKNFKAQNRLLLAASYIFYGSWDWRFLSLLAFVTLLNYHSALLIPRLQEQSSRRQLLAFAVGGNLLLLATFKYLNFFCDSFAQLLRIAGIHVDYVTLHIILPVGISFYIFQAMGYLIDVYRRQLPPCDKLADFALYVSFFPQLVAGPIERAKNLLPQLTSPRKITPAQVNLGLYLILWGFFKKVVVADNLAQIADPVFADYASYQGLDIVLGILAFSIQIYCDFSGYSDVARGLAKLLGIELMINFRLPYFASSPREFWRRWHISLSTWLKDYLYIPLGGSRKGPFHTLRNLGITMLLCGLWHGAGWNFILWGGYHWFMLILSHISGKLNILARQKQARLFIGMLFMVGVNFIGWTIFRATSPEQTGYMLSHLGFSLSSETMLFLKRFCFFLAPLALMEIWQFLGGNLAIPIERKTLGRSMIYGLILVGIITYGVRDQIEFIYYQF